MPEKLRRFAVSHLFERKELVNAMLSGGGEPPDELVPQRGVSVSFWRGGDDVLNLRGVPVVQLRDNLVKHGRLAADARQEELRLGLGEPHSWSFGPERGSRTATLEAAAGDELSAASLVTR
jgi:hypothetical protein